MKKIAIALALFSTATLASPALAGEVGIKPGMAISAVYDASEIQMPPLPSGRSNVGFEADPSFFAAAELCVSGRDDNWAIRKDGTLDLRNPARRASCAPIGPDGRAQVSNPFGAQAVPFIKRADRIIAWAGRDRLTGGLVE